MLIKLIEEMYSVRFARDTANFKASMLESNANQGPDIPDASFARFVFDFMVDKYKNKKLIEQVNIANSSQELL